MHTHSPEYSCRRAHDLFLFVNHPPLPYIKSEIGLMCVENHKCVMGRQEQISTIKQFRESLILELNKLYSQAFDKIGCEGLGDGAVARLTQLLLRSREGAIAPLQEEIEAPLITKAPEPPQS